MLGAIPSGTRSDIANRLLELLQRAAAIWVRADFLLERLPSYCISLYSLGATSLKLRFIRYPASSVVVRMILIVAAGPSSIPSLALVHRRNNV